MKLVQLKQHFFLLPTPRFLADWRVQVVVPALPALLARPFTHWTLLLQPLRYLRPIIKPVLLHQLLNGLILLNYASNTSKVQDCLLMPIIFIIILSLLAQRPRISSTSLKISFKRIDQKKAQRTCSHNYSLYISNRWMTDTSSFRWPNLPRSWLRPISLTCFCSSIKWLRTHIICRLLFSSMRPLSMVPR